MTRLTARTSARLLTLKASGGQRDTFSPWTEFMWADGFQEPQKQHFWSPHAQRGSEDECCGRKHTTHREERTTLLFQCPRNAKSAVTTFAEIKRHASRWGVNITGDVPQTPVWHGYMEILRRASCIHLCTAKCDWAANCTTTGRGRRHAAGPSCITGGVQNYQVKKVSSEPGLKACAVSAVTLQQHEWAFRIRHDLINESQHEHLNDEAKDNTRLKDNTSFVAVRHLHLRT